MTEQPYENTGTPGECPCAPDYENWCDDEDDESGFCCSLPPGKHKVHRACNNEMHCLAEWPNPESENMADSYYEKNKESLFEIEEMTEELIRGHAHDDLEDGQWSNIDDYLVEAKRMLDRARIILAKYKGVTAE